MHIRHPVTVRCGISSFFSFIITVMPPFLGTTWTGLTHSLCGTGYIIPACSNFISFFLTTSLIVLLSLRWGSQEGETEAMSGQVRPIVEVPGSRQNSKHVRIYLEARFLLVNAFHSIVLLEYDGYKSSDWFLPMMHSTRIMTWWRQSLPQEQS